MSDVWLAIAEQRSICIDDLGDRIDLRQSDLDGNEHVITIHKSNLPKLIAAFQAVKG